MLIMPCTLCKYETSKITHYIGVSGKKYPYGNYIDGRHVYRHPVGTVFYTSTKSHGSEELPAEDYPYTISYKVEKKFLVCRESRCA